MTIIEDVGMVPWLLLLKAIGDQEKRDLKRQRYRWEHRLGGKCGWCHEYHYRFRPCKVGD